MNMENSFLNKNLLRPLEDQLRCRICSEFYSNCVMAVCSHNFCSVCIKKRLTTEEDCPCCFEIIQESDLRSNRILDRLVRLYKKLQRDSNNRNTEAQNHSISYSQAQSNSHNPMESDIQMTSVQSSVQCTDILPSNAPCQNSPLIQSIHSQLTDLDYPVKLEIVDCNESSTNDVVMSTNSAEDSIDTIKDIEKILKQQKTVLNTLCHTVKRIETKLDSLLPGVEGSIDTCYPDQSTTDDVYKMMKLLPVNMKNFTELNKMIAENSSFRNKLRRILMTSGGKDYKGFVTKVLHKLLSNEVGERYSLTGKTNTSLTKLPFEKTEVYKLILDVGYQSFPESKENQFREAVGKWFVHSKFRIFKQKEK
nr:protein BREAST CANCER SUSCEPTIBILITY 1 homolog isoform X6 [Parasteatoda tepidariorum]